MRLNYYILFVLFIVTKFVYAQEEQKTLVVFLDNSQSMNDGKKITQCITANYAMQLLAATMNEGDKLILIKATDNKNEQKFTKKNDAINELQKLSCGNADEDVALETAINSYNNISDKNKYLILIGDGEWFGKSGKDDPGNNQKDSIKTFFDSIDKSKLIYINTNKENSDRNKFYSTFKDAIKGAEILQTNSEADKLQRQIKHIIKNLLNIGENGLSKKSVTKNGNEIKIQNKLPLKKIYIIDQSSNGQPKLKNSGNSQIHFKVLSIGNDKLSANFITITKEEFISSNSGIIISGIGNNYEIYAVSNLKVTTPPTLEEGVELKGETYTVCEGKDSLRIAIKFENSPDDFFKLLKTKKIICNSKEFSLQYDKTKKELFSIVSLKDGENNFEIAIETNDGSYKKTFDRKVERKKCDEITKQINKRKGEFRIHCINEKKLELVYNLPNLNNDEIIKINNKKIENHSCKDIIDLSGKNEIINHKITVEYGKYKYQDSVELRQNMCNLRISNVTDTVSFSMLDKADSIVWNLNKMKINDENQFKHFEIENSEDGDYSVRIDRTKTSSFKLVKDNSFKGIIANCFRSTDDDEFVFKLKHPQSANNTIEYKVVIKKTDTGFWQRCKREIIGFLLIILFLIYLYFIITKPRFRKYKGIKAKIIKYRLENGKPKRTSILELKSHFFNRYLNPFGVEKKKINGMLFKAPERYSRSKDIFLSKESINDNIGTCSYNGDTIDINDEGFYANIDPRTKKKIYTDQRIRENTFIYKKTNNNYYIYEYVLRKSSIKEY